MDSTGRKFKVTVLGSSHGPFVGCEIRGCPKGTKVSTAFIQSELDRRRPSSTPGSTPRKESDKLEIKSGISHGKTDGDVIRMLIRNTDTRPSDYSVNGNTPRPGHADLPLMLRYGPSARGGTGKASGRMTAAIVMAGAVAKQLLEPLGIMIFCHTVELAGIKSNPPKDLRRIFNISRRDLLACADRRASGKMFSAIKKAIRAKDSVGGVVECVVTGLPAGMGEPFWDGLEGEVAKYVFAIPAVKGVEFGAGFGAARLKGSENNDAYGIKNGRVVALTNNAGGALGGMTTGMPVVFRAAFKPIPSIGRPQMTVDMGTMRQVVRSFGGRHDACVLPRAVPVVEAAAAMALADLTLRAKN